MELYWKAAAGGLLTLVLCITLSRQSADVSLLLSMAVCSMVAGIALSYLEPVLDFLRELEAVGGLQQDMISVLIKALGIGLVSQVAGMVCSDGGNGSLGKMIQLLGSAVILYLSVPIFSALLSLIREILGEL